MNEPLNESKKKLMLLKSVKNPDELMGEFYYHSDVYSAIEGFYNELEEWLEQTEVLIVEDLLEDWFPSIMKAIEDSKVKVNKMCLGDWLCDGDCENCIFKER